MRSIAAWASTNSRASRSRATCLPDATIEQRVATGFHRNTLRNREGEVNPEQYFFEETVDRASTFGTVWLGLTVGCAQCHDHKYDPLTQRELYKLFAHFDNLDEAHIYAPLPGELGPFLHTVNEYRQKHREILEEYNVPALQAAWERNCLKGGASPGVYLDWDLAWQELGLNTDGGQEIIRIPLAVRAWRQASMVSYYFRRGYSLIVGAERYKELGFPEVRRKLDALNRQYPQRSEARVVFRSPNLSPGELGPTRHQGWAFNARFPPGTRPSQADTAGIGALALPRDNPLTARVAVNRIWQEHLGRGLVATSDDFGTQGETPSHPQLLDWLAAEFRDSGWDVKHMHRLIVTSETYKRSSHVTDAPVEQDPGNDCCPVRRGCGFLRN